MTARIFADSLRTLICSMVSIWLSAVCAVAVAQDDNAPAALDSDLKFLESNVLPILRENCYECHSHRAGKARGGLVLDSLASILKGGDSGPAIEPGRPDASLMIEAIRYDGLEMPPRGRLAKQDTEVLTKWVQRQTADATWSDSQDGGLSATNGQSLAPSERAKRPKSAKLHWAFRDLQRSNVPASTPSAAIDFLLQREREQAGVDSVGLADKRTVVRRLFSDLIGLPPTLQQLDRLTNDSSPSLESIVDELLAMPEFGERWGRHWLDVARYSDSNGCSIESNNTHDTAWRYRDYVITSFNADKPYDKFLVQQLAGDLLDWVSNTERSENLIATGFLVMGPKAFGSKFEELEMDVIDEQIDTLGKASLGITLGCARCHDHKFDPISTEDYYALAGIFASTQSIIKEKGWRQGVGWNRVELPVLDEAASSALKLAHKQALEHATSGELVKQAEKVVEEARKALAGLQADQANAVARTEAESALASAESKLAKARSMATVLPIISPVPVAMAVQEKEKVKDEAVRIRGEVGTQGKIIPRRVLPFLGESQPDQFEIPADQSGRLQLAQWLVAPKRGAGQLVARVAVNRIWGHLFARPLVQSVDNFGILGSEPSHPELLDYLAFRFVESGWSTKTLIRDIVLCKAYQLSSEGHPQSAAIDPSNRWLWRYQPKRVDIEVLRDSMLALSGKLQPTRGGPTLQHLGLVSLGDHILLDTPSPYYRRTIYIPIYRDTLGLTADVDASMGMLKAFDFADPNLMTGARNNTVVPTQSLFLMNADFVREQASGLAERILKTCETNQERIELLTQLVYGRQPTQLERAEFTRFLTEFEQLPIEPAPATGSAQGATTGQMAWIGLCQTLLSSNEFLHVD